VTVAFLMKKLFSNVVLPPFSLLMMAVCGLLVLRKRPRLGGALIWCSVLILTLLSTPIVAQCLLEALNVSQPFTAAAGKRAKAIVILGGGLRPQTPEFGDTPSTYTLERIRYGATLSKATGLPILVTGGAVLGRSSEAQVMTQVLQGEFGVLVRWQETQALDTEDNMKFAAQILKQERITNVILVTHDFHMLRSLAHCAAAGLTCIAAPVSSHGRGTGSWVYELPNAGALEQSALALHEMLGYLVLSLK
jgi:uncharacterized SAM-binding protein YcdF (DUF218 family)